MRSGAEKIRLVFLLNFALSITFSCSQSARNLSQKDDYLDGKENAITKSEVIERFGQPKHCQSHKWTESCRWTQIVEDEGRSIASQKKETLQVWFSLKDKKMVKKRLTR